jgi:hypothetical protein
MNIFEDATHPGIGANVGIRCGRSTEGRKDIHNEPEATHITGQVCIDGLHIGNLLGTEILVGVIVIHQHDITRDPAIDRECGSQLGQNRLCQVRIKCLEIRLKLLIVD